MARIDLDTETAMNISRHSLAQGWNANGRRVTVMSVAQGLDGCFDDVWWCRKIRLADAQIDDVASLRGKISGAGEHGEGVLVSKPLEIFGKFDHDFYRTALSGVLARPNFRTASTMAGKIRRSPKMAAPSVVMKS